MYSQHSICVLAGAGAEEDQGMVVPGELLFCVMNPPWFGRTRPSIQELRVIIAFNTVAQKPRQKLL